MSYDVHITRAGPFGTMTIGGEFFNWIDEEDSVPFKYTEGRITVSSADDYVIHKLKEVAAGLGAIVQGDEGEIY